MGQRRLIVVLVQDQRGGGAEGAPATLYELDLDDPDSSEVRRALGRYVPGLTSGGRATGAPRDPATVRRWARKRRIPISDRGRIAEEIWRQYFAEVGAVKAGGETRLDTVADAINQAAQEAGENVVRLRGRQCKPRPRRGGQV